MDISSVVMSRESMEAVVEAASAHMADRLGRPWLMTDVPLDSSSPSSFPVLHVNQDLLQVYNNTSTPFPCDVSSALSHPSEGAVVITSSATNTVSIHATTRLGATMGLGLLLRHTSVSSSASSSSLSSSSGRVTVPDNLCLVHAPQPFAHTRGHQMTNWAFTWNPFPAAPKLFIQQLALLGTNQVEFAHIDYSRGDGDKLVTYSQVLGGLGLNMSLWFPANLYLDDLNATTALFRSANIQSLFVPGGDGGVVLKPTEFVATVGKMATLFRSFNPDGTVWLSAQDYSWSDLDTLYAALEPASTRSWLTGIVYGPHTTVPLSQFVRDLPAGYPIRLYPDITHVSETQFPLPLIPPTLKWMHSREVVCPMPQTHANIISLRLNDTSRDRLIGFGAYSEGLQDDANKAVWSVLWASAGADGSVASPSTAIRQYCNLFFPEEVRDAAAKALFSLEDAWSSSPDLDSNSAIATAHYQWQRVNAGVNITFGSTSWRLMMHQYRATYDMTVSVNRSLEAAREAGVQVALESAWTTGVKLTVAEAQRALATPISLDDANILNNLYSDLTTLRDRLNATVGLSVLQSQQPDLNLPELTAFPTGESGFLANLLDSVLAAPSANDALGVIQEHLEWRSGGVGGWYDDLSHGPGPLAPRLVVGEGAAADPSYYYTSLMTVPLFAGAPNATARSSWRSYTQSIFSGNVTLRYPVRAGTSYTFDVVLFNAPNVGTRVKPLHILAVRGGKEAVLRESSLPPLPMSRLSLAVPDELLEDGTAGPLDVVIGQETDLSGSGRCCFVSEAWLMEKEE